MFVKLCFKGLMELSNICKVLLYKFPRFSCGWPQKCVREPQWLNSSRLILEFILFGWKWMLPSSLCLAFRCCGTFRFHHELLFLFGFSAARYSFGKWQGDAFLTQCCYGWLSSPIRQSYISFTCSMFPGFDSLLYKFTVALLICSL